MIIDLILDRKDGEPYNAKRFYNAINRYVDVFPDTNAAAIAHAMDELTEQHVKHELCEYVLVGNYNPEICDYINSVNWLN